VIPDHADDGLVSQSTLSNRPPEKKVVSAIDRLVHSWQGRATLGLAPSSLMLAYSDWAVHLASSPGKQIELANKAGRKAGRFARYVAQRSVDAKTPPCIDPLPQDHRFTHPAWQGWPFCYYYQAFLLVQQWWHNATTEVDGVSAHHEEATSFSARQLLDVLSPSNYLLTNPEVLQATLRSGGANLARGYLNLLQDQSRSTGHQAPVGAEKYQVGRDVAVTAGRVVFRNRLMELIQYSPTTDTVHADPVLIVPAWIMKYYILDLSPHNSLVRYLVEHGHTVFMISWHNPSQADRDTGMEDYRTLGIEAALDAIDAIVPDRPVHGVGYCLGGTLLSIEAAAMARDDTNRLASLTLFAAQVDFTEPGELGLFIDEGQVSYLEDIMWEQGYLDGKQMAGAFQLLRSNDLIWSRMVRQYLLGEREQLNDLMAWNADTTRLPYRMHAEYLRELFIRNAFGEGKYLAGGRPATPGDIRVPIFAVGTVRDHVAPWHSVYKIIRLVDTEVTFLLTSGGHNAGIVSPPAPDAGSAVHDRRSYQLSTHVEGDRHLDPQTWQEATATRAGSWWPAPPSRWAKS